MMGSIIHRPVYSDYKLDGWIAWQANDTDCGEPVVARNAANGMAATRENNAGDDGADGDRNSSDARPVIVRGNRIDSGELFAADKEIIITHGADVYRLRLTSQNKLILTK